MNIALGAGVTLSQKDASQVIEEVSAHPKELIMSITELVKAFETKKEKMEHDMFNEKAVTDYKSIDNFIRSIEKQNKELVLTNKGEVVGAILTKEQYDWFIQKLDDSEDLNFLEERINDFDGAISLDDLKKELDDL